MSRVTGLSGNEIFCLALKDYSPGEIVIGNSVNSMGFFGGIGTTVGNILGGEVFQVTEAVQEGRNKAFERMVSEAKAHGASGVAGVFGDLRAFSGRTEFLFLGSCVHTSKPSKPFFTSAGGAQELYCHIDAGYEPIQHAFGNIAYSMGVGRGIFGALKTLARGEIKEYSDIFNLTRHTALERLVRQAKSAGANAVVGIRTTILPWMGTHEMLMSGTAARHAALSSNAGRTIVTSDMTGEELWAMTSLGYAPIKLLMSTSIYSLGVFGGMKAIFKSFSKGEVSDLTTLIHDAREVAIGRLKKESSQLGAEQVVGVKTYIAEIGNGLVEFMAIGTAMKKMPGFEVKTAVLPAQAIIRDRDTWVDGAVGVSLDRND